MPNVRSEADEQTMVITWARLNEKKYPGLELLHHVPNGGYRLRSEAAHLKSMGLKPGVPDLCLPVARGGWHGLYVEMKSASGRVSPQQSEWITKLTAQRYRVAVCYGYETARRVIEDYMQGGETYVGV